MTAEQLYEISERLFGELLHYSDLEKELQRKISLCDPDSEEEDRYFQEMFAIAKHCDKLDDAIEGINRIIRLQDDYLKGGR